MEKRDDVIAVMRDDVGIARFDSSQKLMDVKLIGAAIMECLIDNDPDGIVEVIESHLEALNKCGIY